MRAIDTNVVVRFLTRDDPEQGPIAREIIREGEVFIPVTVMLETEWVLRDGYGYSAPEVADALASLAGAEGVQAESPDLVAAALDDLRAGLDFADALHLARSEACEVFLTFDKRFAKRAAGRSRIPVRAL